MRVQPGSASSEADAAHRAAALLEPGADWGHIAHAGVVGDCADSPPALRRGLYRDDGGGAVAVHLCTHEISGQ